MTKKELIESIATKTGDTLVSTTKTVNALIGIVTDELCNGNEVVIKNFGMFKTSLRTECKGRNPKTGEAISIPAKRVAVFKASAPLKRAINE